MRFSLELRFLLLLLVGFPSAVIAQELFTLERVVPDVYLALAKPR